MSPVDRNPLASKVNRSAAARRQWASYSPEQRAAVCSHIGDATRRRWAALSDEEREAIKDKISASLHARNRALRGDP